MPIALILEILQAIQAAEFAGPQIVALAQSGIDIVTSGTVTPDQEATIRSQLDAVKALIDAA